MNDKPIHQLLPLEILQHEEALDLLADHLASNERVAASVEDLKTKFPAELDRVLSEHRSELREITTPQTAHAVTTVRVPDNATIHLWGVILAGLIILSACIVFAAIIRH